MQTNWVHVSDSDRAVTVPVFSMETMSRLMQVCHEQAQLVKEGKKTVADCEAEIRADLPNPSMNKVALSMFHRTLQETP